MRDEKPAKSIYCVRNKAAKPADEHLACPYCFGKKREAVEQGERVDYCDFEEGRDPLSFGFPEDSTRALKG